MAATTEELLQMILQSLEKVEYIKSEDIPNIDLYMDQVLTFMDRKLRSAVRPQTEDRIPSGSPACRKPDRRPHPDQDHDQQLCEE